MANRTYVILSMLLILGAVMTVWQYHHTATTTPKDIASSTNQGLPEDFLVFYDQFHSDSTFQVQHILFPLNGINPTAEGSNQEYTWTESNWKLHKPFDDMNGTFSAHYDINLLPMIEETISADGYSFDMIRRFAKMENEYYLIYYKSMGPSL